MSQSGLELQLSSTFVLLSNKSNISLNKSEIQWSVLKSENFSGSSEKKERV